jgi:hypothetical protein
MPTALADNDFFVDFEDPASMYDSKGRPLSKAQATFFGSSKCVDEDGSLLVLYHASNKDFTAFDPKVIGSGGGNIFGKGFYFCDSDAGLDIYGKYIKEYYLNLKNPFRWESIEEEEDATYNIDMFIEVLEFNNFEVSEELHQKLEALAFEECLFDEVIEQTCGIDFVQTYLKKAGYDGIMNLDVGDYVAFNPEQIKLCSNKNPTSSTELAA